jgi:hypothetical protein
VFVIDALHDDLIDLRDACREKPFRHRRTGKPAHISSLYRHVMRGARASNGERIRLETVRTPSGLRTSREAIQRFISALTNPDLPPPTTASRRRQRDAAEHELRNDGFEVGSPDEN